MPPACGARPGTDAGRDPRVLPVADHRLAGDPEAGLDEPELAVPVGRLVQVHEVHVDVAPGQVLVELGVQMEERHPQCREPADPHPRRRECVHPGDDADTRGRGVGVSRRGGDPVGRLHDRPVDDPDGDRRRGVQRLDDPLGVGRDLAKRLLAVEVLTTGEEPDLELVQWLHGSLQPWSISG